MNKEKIKKWWKENKSIVITGGAIITASVISSIIVHKNVEIKRLKKENSKSQLAVLHKGSLKAENYNTVKCLDNIYDFAEKEIQKYPQATQQEVKAVMGF